MYRYVVVLMGNSSFFSVQNESGSYTNLIEKTLEGKQYRVAIPEEALAQFLSTLRTLKPFLDQGRPDHDAQLA